MHRQLPEETKRIGCFRVSLIPVKNGLVIYYFYLVLVAVLMSSFVIILSKLASKAINKNKKQFMQQLQLQ